MTVRRLSAALQQPAMIAAVWVGAIFMFANALALLPGRARRLDFSNYYESAWALRHGINPYTADLTPIGDKLGVETNIIVHAADTPTLLLLIEPFTLLDPSTAFWIWTVVKGFALIVTFYLLLAHRPGIPSRTAWLLVGLALMYGPLSEDFIWGQTQIFMMFLLVVAMRAMERGRDAAAGIAIAAAGLLRAYPLLLIGYFLFTGRWRALKFAVAATLVGTAITVALIGVGNCVSFVDGAIWVVRYKQTKWGIDLSLGPFVSRIFWWMLNVAPESAADLVRRAVVIAAELFVLALVVRVTLKNVRDRDPNWRVYGLWIATSIFLSPIAWNHYLILLFIPFVQMIAAANLGQSGPRPVIAAATSYVSGNIAMITFVALVKASPEWILHNPRLFAVLQEIGFFAMLAGFMAAYWFATDSGAERGDAEDEVSGGELRLRTGRA